PPQGYILSPSDQRLYTTLGGQIGVAIENARLYRKTDQQLQKRVTELTATLEELERERAKAKEIERLKDDFVAMISHDLRAPLTSILAQADLLQHRALKAGDHSFGKSSEIILRSGQRMRAMILDLVDSARLESGQLTLNREPLSACSLLDDLARMLPPDDRKRVQITCPEDFPPVMADRNRIERAVTNLIGNALKFSPMDAPVKVGVRSEGVEAVFSITDQGIGIDPEHLPHLFERFYRARAAQGPAGLGLGLYITRLLVELHGGRLWAETVKGQGSTFSFTLPMARPLDPPDGAC
ncbi:MAG: sensor histidine kinase, partial [Myxococcaceae bacterium]